MSCFKKGLSLSAALLAGALLLTACGGAPASSASSVPASSVASSEAAEQPEEPAMKYTQTPTVPTETYKEEADLADFLIMPCIFICKGTRHVGFFHRHIHKFMYPCQNLHTSYNIFPGLGVTLSAFIPVLKGIGNIILISGNQRAFLIFNISINQTAFLGKFF